MVGNEYEDFHLATIHGNLSQLRILFKSSIIDVNARDATGTTALFFACQSGHSHITKLLLSSGASASPKTRHDGATPLHAAAQNGHTECVHLILEHRAYIIEQSRKGDTRHLHLICDTNAQLSDGATPLFLAAQNNHIPVLQALIDAGAEVDLARRDGATALFKASQKGHLSIVQSLLSAGASVGMGGNGETPLHAAVLFGRTRISHLLLLRGADPSCKNKDGFSCLQVAKDANYSDLTVVLEHFATYNNSRSKSKYDQLKNMKNMRVTAPIDASFFRNQNRSWCGSNYKFGINRKNRCIVRENLKSDAAHLNDESNLYVPNQAKPYAAHSSFTEPIKAQEGVEINSPSVEDINFVNILSNAPKEDSVVPPNGAVTYSSETNVKMSSIKCTNLADDCDGNANALSIDLNSNYDEQLYDVYINVPSSAPSVLKHAPWKHPNYDSFLPPSPPKSPVSVKSFLVETVKVPNDLASAKSHACEPSITNTEVSVTPPTSGNIRSSDVTGKRRSKPLLRRQASDAAVTYGNKSRSSVESISDADASKHKAKDDVSVGGQKTSGSSTPTRSRAMDRLTRSMTTLSTANGYGNSGEQDDFSAAPRIRLVGLSARQQLPGSVPVRIPSLKSRRPNVCTSSNNASSVINNIPSIHK